LHFRKLVNGKENLLVDVEMDRAEKLISKFLAIHFSNHIIHSPFRYNPIYHISLTDGSDDNDLLIDLRGPKQYSVGFEIFQVSSYRGRKIENRDSGSFR
jgi:hypothetical protein